MNVEKRIPVVRPLQQQSRRNASVLRRQIARLNRRVDGLLGHVAVSSPLAA